MKIAGSSVQMQAASYYSQYQNSGAGARVTQKTAHSSTGEDFGALAGDAYGEGSNFADYANYTKNGAFSGTGARFGAGGASGLISAANRLAETHLAAGFRNDLLSLLFARFTLAGAFGGQTAGVNAGAAFYTGIPSASGMRSLTYTQVNYQEQEELAFQAAGRAMTEDGRTIDFDMNIFLSRSFVDYTQMQVPMLASALMDPLVVNVGRAVAEVSDQTFRFDLDADGTEEDVAMLADGCGFLALDKNGDGKINDGSELFGATSGDGFGDLRAYDSDGNGWIDENDEVFSRLKVWYRNGDGEDELVDLKTADIGAIFLGEQETEFHLTGAGNRLNGMMRSTGMFLKESGGAGTIQHVDLAVHRDGEEGNGLAEDDALAVGGENFVSGYGTGDRVVPDVLIVQTGGAGRAGSGSGEESKETESASERRARVAEEKERLKKEQQERRAERKRRNAELVEKAQRRREEAEARIEELFADRAERLEEEEEFAAEKHERHQRFEEAYAGRADEEERIA